MREVLFNCFGAVNVEENDNGEFVKLSDFAKLAEKCSRYIDDYERENFKFLELKESISSNEYPHSSIKIYYCPICGRKLNN